MTLRGAGGDIQIPEVFDLRENKAKTGYYLQFWGISVEPDRNGNDEFHKYRINMWIPERDLDKWRERIKPGRKFKLQNAGWRAKCEEGKDYPLNICDVDARWFRPKKN
jgi:hypothetical protein